MSAITLRGLTKRFGSVVAVDDLHLDVQDGELMALLGPSGCGKTTTLRAIAGFELPDAGDIDFGDHRVTNLPPERRNIGMVFQNYALFPHMTVAQNVAFGLEMRKEPTLAIRTRVATTLAKVQLTGLEGRYPRQLSGGQQQRAALARALVVVPDVLLLDEPLANLDAKLREEMRFYVRSLQQEVGITTIYVTHDQAEAMVIADRIAVMFNGGVHQLAPPHEIYHHPRTWRVAEFIGLTNFIDGRIVGQEGDLLVLDTELGVLRCRGPAGSAETTGASAQAGSARGRSGDAKPERLIAVRPEGRGSTGSQASCAHRRSSATSSTTASRWRQAFCCGCKAIPRRGSPWATTSRRASIRRRCGRSRRERKRRREAPAPVAAGRAGRRAGSRLLRAALREPSRDELLHAGENATIRPSADPEQLHERAHRLLPVVDPLAHPQARLAHHALHAAPRLPAGLQPGSGQSQRERRSPRSADLAAPGGSRHSQLRLDGAAGR